MLMCLFIFFPFMFFTFRHLSPFTVSLATQCTFLMVETSTPNPTLKFLFNIKIFCPF